MFKNPASDGHIPVTEVMNGPLFKSGELRTDLVCIERL